MAYNIRIVWRGSDYVPFTKETAAAYGRISGGGKARWKDKDPATKRVKQINIVVSLEEHEILTSKTAMLGLSMTELVVRAVKAYKGK